MSNTFKLVTTGIVSAILAAGITGGASYLYYQSNPATNVVSTTTVNDGKATTKTLSGASDAATVYQAVKEAVVSVINYSGSQESSSGSGVIYKLTDGKAYLVTNNHVVDGATSLKVVLYSGKSVDAKLVGTDAMTDLAVLKIDSTDVKGVAQFADSNEVQVGEDVLAIGSPLGAEYASSVTAGIVSATNRLVSAQTEDGTNLGESVAIQTDTAINPGNSGGPLVNMAGQVIGINSQKLTQTSDGTNVEGMGFAIPSDVVVNIVNKLVKNGEVVRPALGVSLVDLSSVNSQDRKDTLKIPNSVDAGVVIAGFSNNSSPAKKAGIKKYDVITKIDGVKVANVAKARTELYKHNLNDTIEVTYYHQKIEKTVKVKLTEKLEIN